MYTPPPPPPPSPPPPPPPTPPHPPPSPPPPPPPTPPFTPPPPSYSLNFLFISNESIFSSMVSFSGFSHFRWDFLGFLIFVGIFWVFSFFFCWDFLLRSAE